VAAVASAFISTTSSPFISTTSGAGSTTPCTADIDGWLCVIGAQSGCSLPAELGSDGAWVPGTIDECRDTITRSAAIST